MTISRHRYTKSELGPFTNKGGAETVAWSITNEMLFTINNNKENHRHYHDAPKTPPRRQEGNPFRTIAGSAANGRMIPPKSGDPSLGDAKQIIVPEAPVDEHPNQYRSLFTVYSEDSDDSPFDDLDEVDRMMPGVLAMGTAYTVKETIIQGYIEKKGSGFDWLGSRAWKKRWAVLVKARTDGQNVDVPLLQIFWDYHSPTPSTVISLDSAVLLPENNLDPTKAENNHPYRFKIRHVKKSVNPEISVQLTRTLGCSNESERDEWIYSINEALLNYEKEKASARRLSSLSLSPPRGIYRSWVNEDVMPQKTRSLHHRSISSPPRIPLCSRKDMPR